MFPPGQSAGAGRVVRGKLGKPDSYPSITQLERLLDAVSGHFLYAREHQLPLVGLNIGIDIQKVGMNGFSSLTQEEKNQLAPGISCNVDPDYLAFIREAYSDHPHGTTGSSELL
jgi:hypothetical protein